MKTLPFDLRNGPVPDDYWVNSVKHGELHTIYPNYKGVTFVYCKYTDAWVLFDNFWNGWIRHYDAQKFRIDQCLEMYLETLSRFK